MGAYVTGRDGKAAWVEGSPPPSATPYVAKSERGRAPAPPARPAGVFGAPAPAAPAAGAPGAGLFGTTSTGDAGWDAARVGTAAAGGILGGIFGPTVGGLVTTGGDLLTGLGAGIFGGRR